MPPQVEASNLTKIFGSAVSELLVAVSSGRLGVSTQGKEKVKKAVDDVSFTLQAGDRLGIIGKNGAGKSTLLSLLSGIAEPTSGKIKVVGHVTTIMTLGVGLREDLSGRDNIYLDGEIQGRTRLEIDQVIEEIIAFAELGKFIDYPIRTYSTGMKARLAFAMIVTIEPEILIIDEALSVGDAFFGRKATAKIKELCAKGKIVIIVSHGMGSIVDMCNRCFWMDSGKVIMDGDVTEVTSAYLQAVQKEDEAELLGKFQDYIREQSFKEGCRILRLDARKADGGSKNIFRTDDECVLHVGVIAHQLSKPDVKFTMMRLDGFIVYDRYLSEYDEGVSIKNSVETNLKLNLENLALSSGIYKLTIQLCDGQEVVAERSQIIEIQCLNVPRGGRPVLIYPAKITAHLKE